MQARMPDGSVIVAGTCGCDGEYKLIGEKQTPKAKVSVAVGKREDANGEKTTVWANVVAWRGLADVLAGARKGDAILAIGRVSTREYNGKTYSDLNADFVSIASIAQQAQQPAPQGDPMTGLEEVEDDELPF